MLDPLRRRPDRAGIVLDLDGTLAEIVARPELARPVPGAREAVAALVPRYRLVAVLTGRPSAEAAAILGVEGVRYVGLYGMGDAPAPPPALARAVGRAAASVAGAWVEDKGASLAVHYRQAPDPRSARARLARSLRAAARAAGWEVVEGKMVLEVVPPGRPMKGAAIGTLVRETGISAALYAGDDVADLDAFDALDRLEAEGVEAVRVAVAGPETPEELLRRADLVVEGPRGLVALLRDLAR
ncbi:MAG TPA: trehalose-phosphatase [Actinomycetota bacterium]|nr:trehalose-phosphatase [Actinomycetota bacterium]